MQRQVIHVLLIKRGKVVDNGAGGTDLDETVSIIRAPRVDIENSVTGDEVNVPCGIRCQTVTALPDACPLPRAACHANTIVVRAGTVLHHLLESAGVETNYPAMVWAVVAVAAKCDIDHAIV